MSLPSTDLPPAPAPSTRPGSDPLAHRGMGTAEFIALMAAMMAVGALGIDAMLPALQTIGQAFGVADANAHQWIVTVYMLGMGVAQLVYGPLTDRFGRKPLLLVGMTLYVVFGAFATFAQSFEGLLLARALQGVGAAGARVISTSIVRDCYEGNRMARIMSLTVLVFLAAPILAPSLGQLILLAASWQWVFGTLVLVGLGVLLWVALRLPETLAPARRRAIDWRSNGAALHAVLANRQSLGYTLAMTLICGPLMGFINSAPQLFDQTFHAGKLFPVVFACVAAGAAAASLLNARIVERLGMQRVSHGALLLFVLVAMVHLLVVLLGAETLWLFALLQTLAMFCFGLVGGNFGAMAMNPLGHVAGMASAVQGFISTAGGALLGLWVGQLFDGSALPIVAGNLVFGLATLLTVAVTERGVLLRNTTPHQPLATAAH